MSEPRQVSVPTEGGRVLHVLDSGPIDGAVLVLHTGTPGGLVALPAGLDPAPAGIRTVLYARPGYSGSTARQGRRVADAADDTTTILDALGVEKFINIGWSGGGPHALACSARLAGRCSATAIIGAIAPYVGSDAWPAIRSWYEDDEDNRMAMAGDLEGFRRSCTAFGEDMAKATATAVAGNIKSGADRAYLASGYAEWVASFFREAFSDGPDGFIDDSIAFFSPWGFDLEAIGRVSIWHGTEDQNVPVVNAYCLATLMPQAQLHVLEDEGHISIMRHFSQIIDDLL